MIELVILLGRLINNRRHDDLAWGHLEVEVRFLLEIRFDSECLLVHICDIQHLLYGCRVASYETWTEVKQILVQLYTGSASLCI
jgi:hypothetical protein